MIFFDGRTPPKPIFTEIIGYFICIAIIAGIIVQLILSYLSFRKKERQFKERAESGYYKRKEKKEKFQHK